MTASKNGCESSFEKRCKNTIFFDTTIIHVYFSLSQPIIFINKIILRFFMKKNIRGNDKNSIFAALIELTKLQ